MKSTFVKTSLSFILIAAFSSCAFVEFYTEYGLPDNPAEDFISPEEVSVR